MNRSQTAFLDKVTAKLNKIAKEESSTHQDQINNTNDSVPLIKPFRPRETPLITRKWKQARKMKEDEPKTLKSKKKILDKSFIYNDIPKAAEKETTSNDLSNSNAKKSNHVERLVYYDLPSDAFEGENEEVDTQEKYKYNAPIIPREIVSSFQEDIPTDRLDESPQSLEKDLSLSERIYPGMSWNVKKLWELGNILAPLFSDYNQQEFIPFQKRRFKLSMEWIQNFKLPGEDIKNLKCINSHSGFVLDDQPLRRTLLDKSLYSESSSKYLKEYPTLNPPCNNSTPTHQTSCSISAEQQQSKSSFQVPPTHYPYMKNLSPSIPNHKIQLTSIAKESKTLQRSIKPPTYIGNPSRPPVLSHQNSVMKMQPGMTPFQIQQLAKNADYQTKTQLPVKHQYNSLPALSHTKLEVEHRDLKSARCEIESQIDLNLPDLHLQKNRRIFDEYVKRVAPKEILLMSESCGSRSYSRSALSTSEGENRKQGKSKYTYVDVKLGGLGPDKESEEYKSKMEKRNRQLQYAENVRKILVEKSQHSSLFTSRSQSRQLYTRRSTGASESKKGFTLPQIPISEEKKEAIAKRERMAQYAKSVSKPIPTKQQSKQPNDSQKCIFPPIKKPAVISELVKMEKEYQSSMRDVETIRRQLNL